jgi:Bacterial Ig domain
MICKIASAQDRIRCLGSAIALSTFNTAIMGMPQPASPNLPPLVSIAFPPDEVLVTTGTRVAIRAVASDQDRSISRVEFYVGTNLVGTATSPPYTNSFPANPEGTYIVTAVAVDNAGNASTSAPVRVATIQPPTLPTFQIRSPTNQTQFLAPATFRVQAALIASDGRESPVNFFVGTNLVGTATDQPYGVIVSNLLEGTYELLVHVATNAQYYPPFYPDDFNPVQITVAPVGLTSPRMAFGGASEFIVAGNIAGKTNLIEASTNLVEWLSIGTNVPTTNSFLFLDAEAVSFIRRFYRVLLNP